MTGTPAPVGAILDLFAGPGGWDVAAHALGYEPLGIEWDDAACATREAAGLRTLQADVSQLDPRTVLLEFVNANRRADWERAVASGYGDAGSPPPDLEDAELDGLIASPPCQAWSMAGKGGGRRDKELVVQCAGDLAAGMDTRSELRARCEDDRSILAVEPLRWALALRPVWCAFEQVPPVLELWSMFARVLALKGYSTWAGVLEAERYGVPQTRKRAVLIARRDGPAVPPRATHQRYVPGGPQRHDVTLEGEVLPWVSMAEALGWGMTERPGVTFAPGAAAGAAGVTAAGRVPAARCRKPASGELGYRLSRGVGMIERGGDRRAVPEGEPAPTITGLARSAEWVYVNGNQANAARRRGGYPPQPSISERP